MQAIKNSDRDVDNTRALQHLNEKENQLIHAISEHNNLMRQKLRSVWIHEGDTNSKFLYAMYKSKVNKSLISEIHTEDGSILIDQVSIRQELTDSYRKRFQSRPIVNDVQLLASLNVMFTEERNALMSKIPLEQEIEEVVLAMNPSSSPGPDGFSGAFFHSCWAIVKHDMVKGVQSFFRDNCIPQGFNSNFTTLIPKQENPTKSSHFRPICMGNFIFKVIPKILQERIKKILPEVIAKEQTGFIEGRNIQTNIGLASEFMNELDTKRFGGNAALKIDIFIFIRRMTCLSGTFCFKCFRGWDCVGRC